MTSGILQFRETDVIYCLKSFYSALPHLRCNIPKCPTVSHFFNSLLHSNFFQIAEIPLVLKYIKYSLFYPRVQANYVMWRAAGSSVSYLTDQLRKRQLDYNTIVTGRTEREARWKECIDISAGR